MSEAPYTVPGVVYRDQRRGHFRMDLDSGGYVVAADLGHVLHLTTADAHLTPDLATDIADALLWWADRQPLELPPEVEDVDLLSLIEEGA